MKKAIEYGWKLLLICVVATLGLALINGITAPVIEAAARQKVLDAFADVYPGLEDVKPVEDTSVLTEYITEVNEAIVGGQTDGYIYTVASPIGFDGPINFVVGAKNDGTVTGLRIISQTETSGFGARVAEPEYAQGMQGVMLTGALTADGNGGGPDKIPALSGATRTTNAMEKAMNFVVEAHAALAGLSVETEVALTEATPEQIAAAYPDVDETALMESIPENEVVKAVYEAKKGGEVVGHIYHALSTLGFGGNIEILVGVDNDGNVAGMSVLLENETKDLGHNITTPEYQQALAGQPVASADVAITGATFTSDAMADMFAQIETVRNEIGK